MTPIEQVSRVIGYTRVSTAENSGLGLEAQRQRIQEQADRRGWEVTWIEDSGQSAKSLNRPGMSKALHMLASGDAQALVVAKLDRLSRSMFDFASLLQDAAGQSWAVVALDLGVDTSTPSGEMMANVMMSFAAYERKLISQRTRDALAVKRAQGVRLGRPISLPVALRLRIEHERAAGASLQRIADRLNSELIPTMHGGSRWWPSTVRKIATSA